MGDDDATTRTHSPDGDDPLAGIRLLDSPILLFVAFHKAFRGELSELKQLAVEALEIGGGGGRLPLVNAIFKRLQFFKLVYQYHCAAEDEVRLSVCVNLCSDLQLKDDCPTAVVNLLDPVDMHQSNSYAYMFSSYLRIYEIRFLSKFRQQCDWIHLFLFNGQQPCQTLTFPEENISITNFQR